MNKYRRQPRPNKKINGKIFRLSNWFEKKPEAKASAEGLRDIGISARVLPYRGKRWAVWTKETA